MDERNKKISLTSTYTRKEYHNPSIIKTYSLGFSHDVELLCGIILFTTIQQSDWQREFGVKTQGPDCQSA